MVLIKLLEVVLGIHNYQPKLFKHRINQHKTLTNIYIFVHLPFGVFLFLLSLISRTDHTVL